MFVQPYLYATCMNVSMSTLLRAFERTLDARKQSPSSSSSSEIVEKTIPVAPTSANFQNDNRRLFFTHSIAYQYITRKLTISTSPGVLRACILAYYYCASIFYNRGKEREKKENMYYIRDEQYRTRLCISLTYDNERKGYACRILPCTNATPRVGTCLLRMV